VLALSWHDSILLKDRSLHRTRGGSDVHYGRAETIRQQRGLVLDTAYAQHPERFVRKPPQPPALPTAVWINKPEEDAPRTQ
ncbi:MAG TPA: hypothetical protein VE575_01315, partial [Acidimicrobiales bacterium]|nr:hypothetical protein [Acidimicrobiales bacterium]